MDLWRPSIESIAAGKRIANGEIMTRDGRATLVPEASLKVVGRASLSTFAIHSI